MKESLFQGNTMEEFSTNHERINFEKMHQVWITKVTRNIF
jgi:hypothetical protein